MYTFSRVRHNIAAASGIVALSLGALVTATPAQAQSAPADDAITVLPATVPPTDGPDNFGGCPDHAFCMWRDAGGMGTMWTYLFGTVTSDEYHFVANGPNHGGANDQASSFFNNRAWAVGIGKNWPINFNNDPDHYCLVGHFKARNLANNLWPGGSGMNDTISSYELASNNQICTDVNGNN